MFGFKTLFGNFLKSINKLSKKAYTNGLVVLAGCIVTVLLIGTFGFVQSNNVEGKKDDLTYSEETDVVEEDVVEVFVDDDEWLQSENTESVVVEDSEEVLELSEADTLANEEQPELIIEEDYQEPIFSTASNQLLEETNSVLLTEKDYLSLVRIVEAEATGEDIIGKILVANVVLNRVDSSRFPDTIYDVVHQSNDGYYQFSPLSDGRYYTVTVTDTTYEAVERALNGENYSQGALFFAARALASDSAMSWFDANLELVVQHGVHEFYTY